MKIKCLIISFLFCAHIASAQVLSGSSTKKAFIKKMFSLDMSFTDNINYKEIPVDPSQSLRYDYSLMDPDQQMEIRYKVAPITINEKNPALFFRSAIVSMLHGIAQTTDFNIKDFPVSAVKNDFNADFGAEVTFRPTLSFAKGYTKGYLIAYYKANRALVYVFYLFNEFDNGKFSKVVHDTYTAGRFLNKPENSNSIGLGSVSDADIDARVGKFYKDSLQLNDSKINALIVLDRKFINEADKIRKDLSIPVKDRATSMVALTGKKRKEVFELLGKDDFNKWNEWQKRKLRTKFRTQM